MPSDGAELQVRVSADVSRLVGGMNEATAVVRTSAGEMAGIFKSVGASSTAAGAEMRALGYSAEETATALDTVGLSGGSASGALRGVAVGSLQARTELAAVTGSTGGAELALAKLAARSSSLAPLISAAFPVFAALAFAEILGQIPAEFDKIIGKLSGWDAESQKVYGAIVKDNLQAVVSMVETQNEIRDLNQIGKEGMDKFATASKDNVENLHALGNASAELMRSLNAANAELEKLQSWDNRAVQAVGLASGEYEDRVKRLQSFIADLTNQLKALEDKQRELQGPKKDRDAAEQTAAAAQDAKDRLAAQERLAEEQQRDMGELASFSEKLARADLEAINKKIEGEHDLGLARIEAAHTVSISDIQMEVGLAEDRTRTIRNETAAIRERTQAELDAENKTNAANVKELKDKKELPGETPEELIALDAELEKEANRHKLAMATIASEGAAAEAEAQMRSYDRLVSAATESANRQLEASVRADQEKLKQHDVSAQQWVTSERAALDQWYSQQATTLNAALSFAERTYGKEGQEYQALQRKKEQLDQQYLLRSTQITNKLHELWLQITRKMGTEFESTINKLVMGEESWAKISTELYKEVASTFVTNSTKMLEQALLAEVTHKGLLKTEILGDAYASAAHAYKWVMADVPFPANAVLAPAAAATAFGAVMAFGSFETGGIAKMTGPYVLHQGEGVMTARQTAAIDRAGAVTNNTGGARTIHQHVTVNHNGSNMSDADFAKVMHRVMRKGMIHLR